MISKLAGWYRTTFGQALASAVVLWAALPPLDLWVLGWVAPVWWLLLIRRQELPGRRPYRAIWLAGFAFWMAALHWLRLPYWATAFGWVALSAYLACYLPLFIEISRAAVHRLHVPLVVAAPVVFMGLELARGHVITGFNMGALGHTQYRWIELIQIADLTGEYGVSFVVMFVAACLAQMLPWEGRRWAAWPVLPLVAVLASVLVYGETRIHDKPAADPLRVALIQGSTDIEMHAPAERREASYREYLGLTASAVRKYGKLDLIVWPETMFPESWITYEENARVPDEWNESPEAFAVKLKKAAHYSSLDIGSVAQRFGVPVLLGVDQQHFTAQRTMHFNSAVHLSASGEVLGTYSKVHLVMFGEYVPFTDWFPVLRRLGPVNALNLALDHGHEPAAFQVGRLRIAPNICYESVLPHVIGNQVRALAHAGQEPDVLVNLTNDGWFWGSSELDMHLVCGVFRAVECRKPFLIAANTGISAWIDANGRIVCRGPKRKTDTLLAEVAPDDRGSWYLRYGDWPAALCLAVCGFFAAAGYWQARRRTQVRMPAGGTAQAV